MSSLHLTKSCSYPSVSSFVAALAIIPLIVPRADMGTVLVSRVPAIVWLARTPVCEDNRFGS